MAKTVQFGPIFENLVSLCRRNLYEATTVDLLDPSLILNSNGPCGTLLRNNIHYEWMENNVTSDELVFALTNTSNLDLACNREATPSVGSLDKQMKLFSKSNRLPFGLAQYGEIISAAPDPLPNSDVINYSPARLSPKQTLMMVQFYAPPRVANQWYNTWQRRRLSWWKKFSGTPSNFYLETMKSNNGQQTVDIHYKFPWGSSSIEQINNYGNSPIQLLEKETNQNCLGKDGRKSAHPCIIEGITSVETAVIAYLMDALKQKTSPDESIKHVLSLHNRLVPYKVSIAISGTSAQLKEIATFVMKELKKQRISVLGLPDSMSTSLEQQLIRFDEMGVPYCIVLNEGTLKNGIIGLRNRDTMLREQIHISQVSQVLLKYISNY